MCKLPPEATFISNLGAFSPKKGKECKDQIILVSKDDFRLSSLYTFIRPPAGTEYIYTLGIIYEQYVW